LVEDGDTIEIDIPARSIRLAVADAEIARRRAAKGPTPWATHGRTRKVSPALQAYAALTTSAAKGAVRDVSQLGRRR
ncbi:MAG TPA: dihydroxy-acid dehydratase, partial [Caulobacteraceae bacterium]|nr:dihydroxy-acid dehydratase [Caulobacteraceae bacterium]